MQVHTTFDPHQQRAKKLPRNLIGAVFYRATFSEDQVQNTPLQYCPKSSLSFYPSKFPLFTQSNCTLFLEALAIYRHDPFDVHLNLSHSSLVKSFMKSLYRFARKSHPGISDLNECLERTYKEMSMEEFSFKLKLWLTFNGHQINLEGRLVQLLRWAKVQQIVRDGGSQNIDEIDKKVGEYNSQIWDPEKILPNPLHTLNFFVQKMNEYCNGAWYIPNLILNQTRAHRFLVSSYVSQVIIKYSLPQYQNQLPIEIMQTLIEDLLTLLYTQQPDRNHYPYYNSLNERTLINPKGELKRQLVQCISLGLPVDQSTYQLFEKIDKQVRDKVCVGDEVDEQLRKFGVEMTKVIPHRGKIKSKTSIPKTSACQQMFSPV